MPGQRKVLENKASIRFQGQQLIEHRRSLLTMRTLHIAELDDGHLRLRGPLGGSVYTFFQLLASVLKRLRAERQNLAGDHMFAIGTH